MAENLNFGTQINGATNQLNNSIVEKYCYDDLASNCTFDGGFYQWDEMMQYSTIESTQGICPSGWHLPSDAEWKTLEIHLGMTQAQADATGGRGTDQGSKLAGDESYWNNGALDQNGTFGSSGFNAIPAGFCFLGYFDDMYEVSFLWTSTEAGMRAWPRYMSGGYLMSYRINQVKSISYNVRCVKD